MFGSLLHDSHIGNIIYKYRENNELLVTWNKR
jgi:hypothetical protein